jgi:hypothetical protein
MDEGVKGTSRRDVLKVGGVMAAGAASFFAGTAAAAQSADAAVDPHVSGHIPTTIVMEVGGVQVKKIRSASQARMSVNVVATQTGAGRAVFSRGSNTPVTVSVTRDLDGDPSFRTWFAGRASSTGGPSQAIEQSVVLTLLGRHNSTISKLTLTNAWPSVWGTGNWVVPESKAIQLTETVTIVADSATFH